MSLGLNYSVFSYEVLNDTTQACNLAKKAFDDAFENFSIKDENDQRLFLGAFACLKSMSEGYSHHALIYSNSKEIILFKLQFLKLY